MTAADPLELALHIRAAQTLIPGEPGIAAGVCVHIGTVTEWAWRRLRGEMALDLEDLVKGDRLRELAEQSLKPGVRLQCKNEVEDRWDRIASLAGELRELHAITGEGLPTESERLWSTAAVNCAIDAQASVADVLLTAGMVRAYFTPEPDEALAVGMLTDPELKAAFADLSVSRVLYTRRWLLDNWLVIAERVRRAESEQQEEGAR